MMLSLMDSSGSVGSGGGGGGGGYSLEILKQNSLAQEKVAKNGVQKNVHVIVKNTPFTIVLQLNNHGLQLTDTALDLSRLIIEAKLFYDCEEEKEVGFVKAKPMEYKCHVVDNNLQCHVELRIKVLSSQLEDMFFKVYFRAIDSATNTPTDISTISEPIKVISKPDQLKKKPPKTKKDLFHHRVRALLLVAPPLVSSDPSVIDTLIRIEQQQVEQQKLLQRLLKKSAKKQKQDKGTTSASLSLTLDSIYSSALTPSPSSSSSSFSTSSSDSEKLVDEMKLDDKDEDTVFFEESFNSFLRAYLQLNPEDRSIKIRRLVRNTPTRDVETLSELLDIFWAEGLQKDMRHAQGTVLMGNNNNECMIPDCPHRRELEKIDEFYKDFLANTAINF